MPLSGCGGANFALCTKISGRDIKLCYRLPDHCNVFQAEVMTILKAAQCSLSGGVFPENLLIYSDNHAAIKSLKNVVLRNF